MTTYRNIAIVAGILFLITEITAIAGFILNAPILNNSNYVINATTNETRIVCGAFFEILLFFSVIGTSITLFPVLKKYSESIALSTVCFRLLEATVILIGIMCILTIVTLNHQFLKEANPNAASYLMAGKLLVDVHNWTFLLGSNLILGPSTFLTSYVLHKSRLVPRVITYLGLFGGPLISVNAILVTFGLYPQTSVLGFMLAIPVFVYEIFLAVRLLGKGFNPKTIPYVALQNLFNLSRQG